MKLFLSTLIFSATFGLVSADHVTDFGWEVLDVRMPKEVSDHTASVGSDGLMYIAGGCDAKDGNVYIPIDENEGFFACASLSSSFYSFDPKTRTFATLTDLPRPRYRHSSTTVGDEIWLVGGRDVNDALIPEIDVYNIGSKAWSSVTLPAEYQVSDHASFAQNPSYLFVAGGYDQNYTALDTLTRIDASTVNDDTLSIQVMAPLITPRGDISGVAATDGESAFISGGFTHANGFCAPLGSNEEYIFASDQWRALPELVNERGEVVLVEVSDHLYALGGERQLEGLCDSPGDDIDPGEKTVATDEVEVYENGEWKVISDFPNHKFRFAAAADSNGLIYAFGGQTAFDNDCQCFRTVNDVAVFGQVVSSSAPAVFQSLVSLITVALFVTIGF